MYTETDFVKNLRRTHCKGCRDEGDEFHRYCNGQAVIHCYLVKQYIPNDEWRKTIENDITNEQVNEIARAIDNEIIKDMVEKYGLESKLV